MLTPTLSKILGFIEHSTGKNGYCPSYEEIALACNLKSKSNIFYRLQQLEQRGYIRRLPYRARAIEVLKGVPKGKKR